MNFNVIIKDIVEAAGALLVKDLTASKAGFAQAAAPGPSDEQDRLLLMPKAEGSSSGPSSGGQ